MANAPKGVTMNAEVSISPYIYQYLYLSILSLAIIPIQMG